METSKKKPVFLFFVLFVLVLVVVVLGVNKWKVRQAREADNALTVSGWTTSPAHPSALPPTTMVNGELMNSALSYVLSRLIDSDSAKISAKVVYVEGGPVVCGTVNAKNSFGGYVGDKPFFLDRQGKDEDGLPLFSVGVLITDEDVTADTSNWKQWKKVCGDVVLP
jgi:hypothetical protein